MDAATAALFIWLLGAVVSVFVLYFAVRLAVRHGIRDSRADAQRAVRAAPQLSHLDADGL